MSSQEKGWGDDKSLKKVFGMEKSAREGSLSFSGWPPSHVVAVLWGTGGGKLMIAMRHNELCAPA
jgi:hypothetical protein